MDHLSTIQVDGEKSRTTPASLIQRKSPLPMMEASRFDLDRPMRAGAQPTLFETLDECHRQIGARMRRLGDVAQHAGAATLTGELRREAGEIESFFSGVSRAHHEQEESSVFPPLLAIGDPVLVETVRLLQQEHAWIESRWKAIAPRLRSIAAAQDLPDTAGFVSQVQEFLQALRLHMELEDTVVYPESRTHWARAVAARIAAETPPHDS
jgi:hemerythrin-like domain-containing protein